MVNASQSLITIENSITNPDSSSKHWIDNEAPLSFFDFLKHINRSATPVEFNDFYNTYLHNWYEIKETVSADIATKVRDRYVDLIKDISLNFTTAEEKRFLSNIDFDDPEDLAIAIPFYSSKISEICQFYTKKREQVKTKIESNKIKGTSRGLEKTIFNIIVDYIFIDDADESYNTAAISLSSITRTLDIEIEELFDIYSDYYNIDSDLTYSNYDDGGSLRNTYFTTNQIVNTTEDIADLFVNFDSSLRRDIFTKPFVLSGFGNLFSLNIEPSFLDLVSNENVQNLISSNLPTSNLKLNLKKKLLEKYIGTDIYYLSTNSTATEYVSGILFKSQEPTKNLINNRFATIAAVPSNELKSNRDIGLFFTPDKLGLLHFKTGESKYRIRTEDLIGDKIYVFPDPDIYGNTGNITDEVYEYPLYYVIDNSKQVKSNSYGFAVNDVFSTSYDQLFYAYGSSQERYNSQVKSLSSLDKFNHIVNRGIITEWFQDIYGNQYGVFKAVPKSNISYDDPEPDAAKTTLNCVVIDGYLFKDGIEGFGFDYSIDTGETFNSSLRTGITARTIDEIGSGTFDTGYTFVSSGMFELTASPVRSLYFREFDPYIDAIFPNSYEKAIVDGELCDGVGFMYGDDTFLQDPVLADDAAFSTTQDSYYNTLLEAGLDLNMTLDAVISGDGSFYPNFPLSAAIAEINDGGSFLTDISIINDYPFDDNNLPYYNIDNTFSSTLVDTATSSEAEPSVDELNALNGIAFIYNASTNIVLPISAAMSDTFSSLPSAVYEEIYSDINWISVDSDVIFVQTSNYYIVERISFENNEFVSSSVSNIYYTSNSNNFDKFSKPFFVSDATNNKAYFTKLTVLSATSALNEKALYPEIYEYNIDDHTSKKIYPVNLDEDRLNALYSLSGLGNVNIVSIGQPDIAYNSRNDIISITVIGEDSNELGYIFNFKYRKIGDTTQNISAKAYRFNANGATHNFFDTTLSEFVSSTSTEGSSIIKVVDSGELFFN